MIVREVGNQVWIVLQTDHARQCGEFAAAWGNESVLAPEPRKSVVFAAAEHDEGWRDWEDSPRVDPATGLPYQFYTIPVLEHVALYRRGIQHVAARDSYAGLLVSLHALRLYGQSFAGLPPLGRKHYSKEEKESVEQLIREQEPLQQSLIERMEPPQTYPDFLSDSNLIANFRLLQAWDALSLQTLTRSIPENLGRPKSIPIARGSFELQAIGEWSIRAQPYPFDREPFTTGVRVWTIPKRRYVSDADLREAWSNAEPIDVEITFRSS